MTSRKKEFVGGPLDGESFLAEDGQYLYRAAATITPEKGMVKLVSHVYELCIDDKFRYKTWELG